LIKVHNRQRRERGQTLIFLVLAMPVFLAIIALVIDGSMLLVKKRALQNAADAAALAAAQDWPLGGSCVGGCLTTLQSRADTYSNKNGGPALHPCNDPDPTNPTDSNCVAAPYVDKNGVSHPGEVEVRLTSSQATLFTKAIGLGSAFGVSARSVAGSNPILGSSTIPGTTVNGTTTINVIPGGTHTTTDPSINSGGSGIAFTMSRVCSAISYTGAGAKSGDPVLGAFATNGGFDFQGNSPKKVTWLGFNQTGCPNNPSSPPSGTNQCTSPAWGDASESQNNCAKTLVNLNQNNTLPINWPLIPPKPPTTQLPAGTTWDAANYYPTKCIDPGTNSIGANWANTHPPGIYCVSGANTTLQFASNGTDLTNGDGYTFFALGGAKIQTSGQNFKAKFYWPSGPDTAGSCGPRPTTTRPPSPYTCFGRTISDYDGMTMFYATNTSSDGSCAICLQGGNGNITGDIFAPKPDVFPPTPGPAQTGGLVSISGGGLSAGQGFIESWNLTIQGNTGSYRGTGTAIVIPGATHTTTDAATTQTIVQTGTTNPGTVVATTIGTDIGLGE
jgi:Flp pilus assembly protein TadG